MEETIKNPLLEGELEGMASLCLKSACLCHLATGPLEKDIAEIHRRNFHAMKRRFKSAIALMKQGETSLFELGLTAEDCSWAASNSDKARDQEGWKSRFEEAAEALRQAAEGNSP